MKGEVVAFDAIEVISLRIYRPLNWCFGVPGE